MSTFRWTQGPLASWVEETAPRRSVAVHVVQVGGGDLPHIRGFYSPGDQHALPRDPRAGAGPGLGALGPPVDPETEGAARPV